MRALLEAAPALVDVVEQEQAFGPVNGPMNDHVFDELY